MLAMLSIEAAVCSMSTRAKSRPAAFSNVRIAGLRTRFTHVPICSSPRSRAARSGLACMSVRSRGYIVAPSIWDAIERRVLSNEDATFDQRPKTRCDIVGSASTLTMRHQQRIWWIGDQHRQPRPSNRPPGSNSNDAPPRAARIAPRGERFSSQLSRSTIRGADPRACRRSYSRSPSAFLKVGTTE